jgi:magnesium-protoporphyrin IX monomethyl ester (oxidative) cyclase
LTHGALPEGIIGPEHRAAGDAAYQALYDKPPRARLEDMDRSPAPDYDDYFAQLERSPLGKYIEPALPAETSRGCWWGEIAHCTFCGLNGTSMGYRAKSPARVVDEFRQLSERYGLYGFQVVDNILDLAYLKTVVPELARAQRGYQIFYEIKANVTRSQLRLMSEAGIRFVQPGIESLDDGLLKALAKGTTTRKNLEMLKWALEVGIDVVWNLLCEIPGETDEPYHKMAEWFPLVEHLEPPRSLLPILIERFSPYHVRPEQYQLNIAPDRAYAFVYPWQPETLGHFAYFFEDHKDSDLRRAEPTRLGLRRIWQATREWSAQWFSNDSLEKNTQPVLSARRDGERLIIRDTRRVRVRPETVLDGLAVAIHDACDASRTLPGLRKELAARGVRADAAEVEATLHALVADKLVLALDDWYFSLALSEPVRRLPSRKEWLLGRFRSEGEVRELELMAEAEALLDVALPRR